MENQKEKNAGVKDLTDQLENLTAKMSINYFLHINSPEANEDSELVFLNWCKD